MTSALNRARALVELATCPGASSHESANAALAAVKLIKVHGLLDASPSAPVSPRHARPTKAERAASNAWADAVVAKMRANHAAARKANGPYVNTYMDPEGRSAPRPLVQPTVVADATAVDEAVRSWRESQARREEAGQAQDAKPPTSLRGGKKPDTKRATHGPARQHGVKKPEPDTTKGST